MRVLGVDPGTRHTGFGIVEEAEAGLARLTCLAMGVISPSNRLSMPGKLKKIHDGLVAVILRHSPGVVVVENTFLSKNIQIAFKLGQARGVALLVGELHGLVVAEYTPTQIKLAMTGHGAAQKEQVSFMVSRILGLSAPPETDHASDALAAAICYHHSFKMENLNRPRPEELSRR